LQTKDNPPVEFGPLLPGIPELCQHARQRILKRATAHSHSIVSHARKLLLHQHFFLEPCDFTVSPTDDLRRLKAWRADRLRTIDCRIPQTGTPNQDRL